MTQNYALAATANFPPQTVALGGPTAGTITGVTCTSPMAGTVTDSAGNTLFGFDTRNGNPQGSPQGVRPVSASNPWVWNPGASYSHALLVALTTPGTVTFTLTA